MKHIKLDDWLLYIEDELAEDTRKVYEEHLSVCDHCFKAYLQAIDKTNPQEEIPSLNFTEDIVQYVEEQAGFSQGFKSNTKKKSLIHYAIAASMTALFMFTGLFTELIEIPSYVKKEIANEEKHSFTDKLLEKRMEVRKNVNQKEGEQ